MFEFVRNLFDFNEKEIRRLRDRVQVINGFESDIAGLPDDALRAKTGEFKERLANGASLDDILPEAFAVVREAAKRTVGMRHFDVQLMGGIVLHEGRIAEMKTGEGKTLVATLAAYLNALPGKGVHIVTVNDYLARRDAEWMGSIYRFLGLSVGVIVHGLDYEERRDAYNSDITYGTNNEFGFDYLRDNMVTDISQIVQRELNYAIVDEVDSILIDEARTPLIISGQAEESTDLYYQFARLVPRLKPEQDYTVDEKAHAVAITEEGVAKVEQWLKIDNLYDDANVELTHHLNQALRAHALMKRDRDYVVKDGQVIIVDEFTGRLMFGRRYSDGLHQAIEAKESVKVEHESQTLASITFQNYFRMYKKLAGMTGTAATEEEEFRKIYGLDVVVIPTNEPMIRTDHPDVVYKTERAKFNAVVEEIVALHAKGQPVLVGTISIEKSEILSDMLRRRGIPHQVLNAKHHEKEAEIIAQAGRLGAVTIATNMAGRGTDIILGGNPEYLAKQKLRGMGYPPDVIALAAERSPVSDPQVLAAREKYQELVAEFKRETSAEHEKVVQLGGLHILGTERHESRRIDNQLRGRSGRQGDPGSSRFYVSLEDDLMRLFGGEFITNVMNRLGWDENQPIEHPRISKSIESAQKKVEARNFDIRKQVLEYDDVMNKQREVIYDQRRRVLLGEDLKPVVIDMMRTVLKNMLDVYANEKVLPEEWDVAGLCERVAQVFALPQAQKLDEGLLDGKKRDELLSYLEDVVVKAYEAREAEIGAEQMRMLERLVMLRIIDNKWMDHLQAMDDLREGIGLRAYGERNPLIEYKVEAFEMFKSMIASIQEDVVRWMFRVGKKTEEAPRARRYILTGGGWSGAAAGAGASGLGAAGGSGGGQVTQRRVKKVGRNDPCPCGSGKKYKKCCGR
ncbi:MAG: preprotein translocase subunit SecA [Firmicutes bacterium]|nr:preprotein translocase subunit SecA [Bacillota bacterium]